MSSWGEEARSLGSAEESSQPLQLRFEAAASHAAAMRARLSISERLKLYAFYKQARSRLRLRLLLPSSSSALLGDAGPCTASWASLIEQAKHSAWAARRGLSPQAAKAAYVSSLHAMVGSSYTFSPSPPSSPSPSFPSLPHLASLPPASSSSSAEVLALRQQIEALQRQCSSLCEGVLVGSGWLHVWRPQSGSWLFPSGASRWHLRWFTLKGDQLSYFKKQPSEGDVPRRTIEVANCVVVEEGCKKSRGRSYWIFSLWTQGTLGAVRGPGSGALLRLSCEGEKQAEGWIQQLRNASVRRTKQTEGEGGLEEEGGREGDEAAGPSSGLRRRRGGEPAKGDAPSKPVKPPLDPFLFPASRPMHRAAQPSLLSAQRVEQPDLHGFVNLCLLIFFATNLRLLLENLKKYGLLVKPPSFSALVPPLPAVVMGSGCLALPLLLAWAIERGAVGRRKGAYLFDWLHAINAAGGLVVACALVHMDLGGGGALGGVSLLLASITLFMKLCSYAHVHHDLRVATSESSRVVDLDDKLARFYPWKCRMLPDQLNEDDKLARFEPQLADMGEGRRIHYPANVTLPNILYFAAAPTLCYQYMVPILRNSAEPVQSGDVFAIVERLLKLAVPTTYVWLSGFYLFFVSQALKE
ncbi:MAG: hypothetical protein SGPRY_002338 [Prymnesium sp.]